MLPRIDVTNKPISSPLSDPINCMVISGAEVDGSDSQDPTLPNPSSLFWNVLQALAFGDVEVYQARKTAIARREAQVRRERAARPRTEYREELDEVTA